jgi:hypothetical protein
MKAMHTESNDAVDGYNLSGSTLHKAGCVPEQRPWTGMTLESARQLCSAMGTGYHLITNAEWMQVAGDALQQAANWSGQAAWEGRLNTGHSDCSGEPGVAYPASVVSEIQFLAAGSDGEPCLGTGNPNCQDPLSPDFKQRRTHLLGNGERIWDLAGNVNEWVDVDDCGSNLSYDKNWAGEVVELDSAGAEYSYAHMSPLARDDFVPEREGATSLALSELGIGKIRFAAGSAPFAGRGLFRSGKVTEECQGNCVVGTGNGRVGLFSAWVAYADTEVFANLGFRCSHRP